MGAPEVTGSADGCESRATVGAAKQPFSHIVIIGLGLIGSSFAGAVHRVWPAVHVLGVDVDERTRTVAAQRNIVSAAVAPDSPLLEQSLRGEADLVVLATPVDVDEPYLDLIARCDYQGIVTDTASTKDRIVAMAASHLRYPANYIPGHPMAGSEVNGIDGARGDLFQGAYWILCPDENTPGEHFQKLHELITGIQARVISLPREQHDRAVAVVSHVPHFTASSLAILAHRASDDQQTLMRLAAGGFKDSTRIAAGSPKLWCGIAFDNAERVHDGIEEIRAILEQFASALEQGDRAALTVLLAEASEARRQLPAAWVPSTDRLLEVRIPMANRTGVVAEVTTIASSVGCNIQSIEIDHVTEDSAVLDMILTDEGDIGKLSAQLIDAGFSISFSPLNPKEHIHVS